MLYDAADIHYRQGNAYCFAGSCFHYPGDLLEAEPDNLELLKDFKAKALRNRALIKIRSAIKLLTEDAF